MKRSKIRRLKKFQDVFVCHGNKYEPHQILPATVMNSWVGELGFLIVEATLHDDLQRAKYVYDRSEVAVNAKEREEMKKRLLSRHRITLKEMVSKMNKIMAISRELEL